jgi:hypothetical protein
VTTPSRKCPPQETKGAPDPRRKKESGPLTKPAFGDFGHFVNGQSRKKGPPFFSGPRYPPFLSRRTQGTLTGVPSCHGVGKPRCTRACLCFWIPFFETLGFSLKAVCVTPFGAPCALRGTSQAAPKVRPAFLRSQRVFLGRACAFWTPAPPKQACGFPKSEGGLGTP